MSPLLAPLRAPSRADPSGLGHATTIYSSVQGPPGVETPTKTVKQYLGLVHVFGHLMTRRKNLANQIHKFLVTMN
jgi:hypothetical protein